MYRTNDEMTACVLIFVALSSSLLLFFLRLEILAFVALLALITIPIAVSRGGRGFEIPAIVCGATVFLFLRKNLLDFSLIVGDASAYTWDAVRSLTQGDVSGFFPPLSSGLSTVAYAFFGLKGIAAGNVLASLATACVIFFLAVRLTGNKMVGFLAAAFFGLQPLSVWFSKTTFSETSWQLLVFACVLGLLQFWRTRTLWPTLLLAGLLAVTNLSRGSAPFAFFPILMVSFAIEGLDLGKRLGISIILGAAFLAALALTLYLRSPYLIDWQYSRVIPSITAAEVWALIAVGTCAVISIAALLNWRFGRNTYAQLLIIGFAGFKIACIGVTVIILHRSPFSDEFSFLVENFGYAGSALALIGLLMIGHRAFKGDVLSLALIGIYAFAAAPFALQQVSAYQPHEMALYWSRYFYGEMFIVYVLAIVFSAYSFARRFAHLVVSDEHKRNVAGVAGAVILSFSCVNWPLLRYVISASYLHGSSSVILFMADVSRGQKTLIIGDNKPLYSSYSAVFMVNRIGDLAPTASKIKEISAADRVEAEMLKGYSRVICINISACAENSNLSMFASISRPISWEMQSGDYQSRLRKKMFLSVVAYNTN